MRLFTNWKKKGAEIVDSAFAGFISESEELKEIIAAHPGVLYELLCCLASGIVLEFYMDDFNGKLCDSVLEELYVLTNNQSRLRYGKVLDLPKKNATQQLATSMQAYVLEYANSVDKFTMFKGDRMFISKTLADKFMRMVNLEEYPECVENAVYQANYHYSTTYNNK